ncbi:(2Fe-2S)-binding protein [Helicovermis profundi]|uniref:(2Fe-2S)-binding protein n=1 Tax=Helicovermis profundi TaxID=3065157 RepID=A0AAU9E826_9FIRM|nr:(2Fe-2S)-binding protein [Clostridia bacterium S502]
MKYKVKFTLNNEEVEHYVDTNMTLLKMLREDFDMTGAKEGCGAGECGACTVIMDGEAINSCLVLAPEVDGREILTIEGLGKDDKLDPMQETFIEHAALQCGYCTPGMILSAKDLLKNNPNPTRDEIKEGMSGNLCRCTGYKKIVDAIEDVASKNTEK